MGTRGEVRCWTVGNGSVGRNNSDGVHMRVCSYTLPSPPQPSPVHSSLVQCSLSPFDGLCSIWDILGFSGFARHHGGARRSGDEHAQDVFSSSSYSDTLVDVGVDVRSVSEAWRGLVLILVLILIPILVLAIF